MTYAQVFYKYGFNVEGYFTKQELESDLIIKYTILK